MLAINMNIGFNFFVLFTALPLVVCGFSPKERFEENSSAGSVPYNVI